MIGWLLDTNIVSELRRPKPEQRVVAFVAAQPLDRMFLSTVTLAEIRFGIELVTNASRRAELNDWLELKMRPMFEQRVLPISEEVMLKWRLLVEQGRKSGHTFTSATPACACWRSICWSGLAKRLCFSAIHGRQRCSALTIGRF